MKLFASIYVGSYETTMKVFEINKQKKIKTIETIKAPTDVIKDVLNTGSILPETTDKLCKVLLDIKSTIESYKVDSYAILAGPNIKQADNALIVLEQIKQRTGFSIEVISNSEQRFLGYQAVASTEDFEELINESAVLIDIGGVSLQITLFSKGKIITTQHLSLGTVAVSEDIKKLGTSSASFEQINEMVYKELEVFKTMFLRGIEPKYMILLGVQVSTFAEKIGSFSNKKVSVTDYLAFLNKINKNVLKQLESENDIYFDNENIIEPVIMLYKSLAETFLPKMVVAPGVSVCEGMAYNHSFNKKWLTAKHDFDNDIITAAWSIAKRYDSYQPHLKALFKLSGEIFDTMKKYHGMGKRQRVLMQCIAILHDCGKYISLAEASSCSYTIIMASEILGLSHKEREIIATTVEFNRKPLEPYESLSDRFTIEEYLMILKLLAILKVANALDRSHKQKIKNVSMRVKDRELIITIEANSSLALEKGLFKKNADFFEQIFSIKPVLKENKRF
ncbi:exopolyphosphatase / guanosine-5'-triphosphate,3'-diphosphate pyrophosphatase [Pseudobutyrivibrio sp. ACV-2]|uniref:Ppx/GppA phosphatase family protein n=1 Tax=Pseudobutyrivibrio sp. ACV-2 TaxID=1520801 RepID=UPI00089C605E|nr:HD domain-containing protein [Pseudobutyrivibrio sp. ACV-2]SDZ84671.1 exopolyphosphatase / guanosine-5'-triphosphate,3'-diphosphate pyrophosphatase [Pseudobutyrivibrio sp. ACV-2]